MAAGFRIVYVRTPAVCFWMHIVLLSIRFYAKVQNNMVVFGSADPKTNIILNSDNWLSKDLFGLTDDDLNKLISDKIKPFLLQTIRQKLDI